MASCQYIGMDQYGRDKWFDSLKTARNSLKAHATTPRNLMKVCTSGTGNKMKFHTTFIAQCANGECRTKAAVLGGRGRKKKATRRKKR